MSGLGRTYVVLAAGVVCAFGGLSCSSILGLDEFTDADPPNTGGGTSTGGGGVGGDGAGPSGGGEGGNTGGSGGAGTGGEGGSFCEPLVETEPCYTGPDGTLGEGICVEGAATCNAAGTAFGPCEDDVVPEPADDCATADDENCDGQPNDGCPCAPNEIASCYTGPAGTLNMGICTAGSQQCNPEGTMFGPCTGDVTPQPETCNTPADDNCNGMTNEGGVGCVCIPNAIDPCYTGPAGTLGVGLCMGGMQQCNNQGTAYGACNGQVVPATESCLLVGDEDCDASACSQPLWSRGAGDSSSQRGMDIAGDAAGNTYAFGRFAGTINLGGSNLTSSGLNDLWLAKYSPTGAHVWSKKFGSSMTESAIGLAVNSAGDIAITGSFSSTINFGGTTLTSLGSNDVYVAKFDTAGAHVWSKRFGDANSQAGKDVTISPNGNVTVFGEYYGLFNFGGSNLPSSPAPDQGMFIAQLASTTGNHVWTRGVTSAFGYARSLGVDASGNIYTAGGYAGTANPGCGTQTTDPGYDAWVARYSGTTGTCVWSKLFSGDDTATTEVIDVEGTSVFVSGEFQGPIAIGTVNLNAFGTNTNDVFVARLSTTDGSTNWAKRIGDSDVDNPGGIAAAPGGGVHVGGKFTGTINLGGADHTSAGLDDVFLARFDSAGVLIWSKSYGDGADQEVTRLGRDGQFNLLATGFNTGVINFGGNPLPTGGGEDVFLVKIGH